MDLNNYSKKIDKLMKEISRDGKKLISELIQKQNFPEWFIGFSWTQFTDYYCDGEECVFGVINSGNLFVNIEKMSMEVREYIGRVGEDEEGVGVKYFEFNPYAHIKFPDEMKPLYDFWKQFFATRSDIFKTIFGDHVEVTVYVDGRLAVEEYIDHE